MCRMVVQVLIPSLPAVGPVGLVSNFEPALMQVAVVGHFVGRCGVAPKQKSRQ